MRADSPLREVGPTHLACTPLLIESIVASISSRLPSLNTFLFGPPVLAPGLGATNIVPPPPPEGQRVCACPCACARDKQCDGTGAEVQPSATGYTGDGGTRGETVARSLARLRWSWAWRSRCECYSPSLRRSFMERHRLRSFGWGNLGASSEPANLQPFATSSLRKRLYGLR